MNYDDRNYVARRISREMFFGYTYIKYYDFYIPVSDIEKTLIDFIYYNEKIPEYLFDYLKENASKKILKNYTSRINKKEIKNKLLKSLKI